MPLGAMRPPLPALAVVDEAPGVNVALVLALQVNQEHAHRDHVEGHDADERVDMIRRRTRTPLVSRPRVLLLASCRVPLPGPAQRRTTHRLIAVTRCQRLQGMSRRMHRVYAFWLGGEPDLDVPRYVFPASCHAGDFSSPGAAPLGLMSTASCRVPPLVGR